MTCETKLWSGVYKVCIHYYLMLVIVPLQQYLAYMTCTSIMHAFYDSTVRGRHHRSRRRLCKLGTCRYMVDTLVKVSARTAHNVPPIVTVPVDEGFDGTIIYLSIIPYPYSIPTIGITFERIRFEVGMGRTRQIIGGS